jgi:hypothetical protein
MFGGVLGTCAYEDVEMSPRFPWAIWAAVVGVVLIAIISVSGLVVMVQRRRHQHAFYTQLPAY